VDRKVLARDSLGCANLAFALQAGRNVLQQQSSAGRDADRADNFAALGMKYVFKADHQPCLLVGSCGSVAGAAISAAEASPIAPVWNL